MYRGDSGKTGLEIGLRELPYLTWLTFTLTSICQSLSLALRMVNMQGERQTAGKLGSKYAGDEEDEK